MAENNQSLTGYNKTSGLKYIEMHLKKYALLRNTYISPKLSVFKKIIIDIDFIMCAVFLGAGINDYFQYKFYKRKLIDRKNFIVGRKWHKIIKKCNGKINHKSFDDKNEFNRLFSDFIKRDWLDMAVCSYQEFEKFTEKHIKFISKIKNGSGGNGISVIKASEDKGLNKLYQELKEKDCIIEEIITQSNELAEFNPSSINSLRIVTIKTKNETKIMNAVFRTGNGEGITDNFHHYGLAALIDVNTGVVISPAVDKNNMKYYFHPSSKKQIIGYQIPNWQGIIKTVKAAAEIIPNVRYIGWDIALNEKNTAVIIEGNCASDPDIVQIPDQTGKWPEYNKIISKL